jgi:hypothetical protein
VAAAVELPVTLEMEAMEFNFQLHLPLVLAQVAAVGAVILAQVQVAAVVESGYWERAQVVQELILVTVMVEEAVPVATMEDRMMVLIMDALEGHTVVAVVAA